uniref:Uncharacterized protein n=1 Tax=Trichuris muris TaxID=70415 RepID=A0A5S6QDL3_TRIMR
MKDVQHYARCVSMSLQEEQKSATTTNKAKRYDIVLTSARSCAPSSGAVGVPSPLQLTKLLVNSIVTRKQRWFSSSHKEEVKRLRIPFKGQNRLTGYSFRPKKAIGRYSTVALPASGTAASRAKRRHQSAEVFAAISASRPANGTSYNRLAFEVPRRRQTQPFILGATTTVTGAPLPLRWRLSTIKNRREAKPLR